MSHEAPTIRSLFETCSLKVAHLNSDDIGVLIPNRDPIGLMGLSQLLSTFRNLSRIGSPSILALNQSSNAGLINE
jgi:hypothetical protein